MRLPDSIIKLTLPLLLGLILIVGNWKSQSLALNLVAITLILISILQYLKDKREKNDGQYELTELRIKLDRELKSNKQFKEAITNRNSPEKYIDNLKKVLNDFKSLSVLQKALIHIELGQQYQHIKDWVSAIAENNKALVFTNSLRDGQDKVGLLGSTEYAFGRIESYRNNYRKAVEHFRKAEALAIKGSFTHMLPFIYRDLGQELRNIGEMDKALIESAKSSNGFTRNGDSKNLAISLAWQSLVYADKGLDEESIRLSEASNKISTKGHWDDISAENYLQIANRYIAIAGKNIQNQNQFKVYIEKGKIALNKAISFFSIHDENNRIPYCTAQLGHVANLEGNLALALDYFEQAKLAFKSLKDKRGLANEIINIGLVKMRQKDYESAIHNFNEGLNLHEQMSYMDGIAHVSKLLGVIYNEMDDTKTAITHFRKSQECYTKLQNPIAETLSQVIGDLEKGEKVTFS
ncbi:MAG: tetratricopeptide repeat protein [Cyclobacteriaceae bacterium]|nr:tetratricopeptide repeat protein [Cyclobacteriaceae bacterium]